MVYEDQKNKKPSGSLNYNVRPDSVKEITGVGTREAASKLKDASAFIPGTGGEVIKLMSVLTLANENNEDGRLASEQIARRLGISPQDLEANSATIRALMQKDGERLTKAAADWGTENLGGVIGGTAGMLVPIPFASVILGYAGKKVGAALTSEDPEDQIGIQRILVEVENKQIESESWGSVPEHLRISSLEAALLALGPKARRAVALQAQEQIPSNADPETARYILDGIVINNDYLLEGKVSQLIELGLINQKDGESNAEAIARAMNEPNLETGEKLHPLLLILDNPADVMSKEQGEQIEAPPASIKYSGDSFVPPGRTPSPVTKIDKKTTQVI